MRYAVVLAGVTGRIVNDVVGNLRARFSDRHVFRGVGARLHADGLVHYDDEIIAQTFTACTDAIFGKSKRPHGFCKNASRGCALTCPKKQACDKSPDQSCSLSMPNFLIVLYQEGQHQERLARALHFAALTRCLPRHCYNRRDRTTDLAANFIKSTEITLGTIRKNTLSANSPLLLPPDNFGSRQLTSLLQAANETGGRAESEQFRAAHSAKRGSARAYTGRSNLRFRPSAPNARHGLSDVQGRPEIAISRIFRLGCSYPRDFHYDVQEPQLKHYDGKIPFHCRLEGTLYPKGVRHVNVTVDDCVL